MEDFTASYCSALIGPRLIGARFAAARWLSRPNNGASAVSQSCSVGHEAIWSRSRTAPLVNDESVGKKSPRASWIPDWAGSIREANCVPVSCPRIADACASFSHSVKSSLERPTPSVARKTAARSLARQAVPRALALIQSGFTRMSLCGMWITSSSFWCSHSPAMSPTGRMMGTLLSTPTAIGHPTAKAFSLASLRLSASRN